MKELVPKDDYGVFADTKEVARADSLLVAETFGKRHDNIIRDIEKLVAPDSGLSKEFSLLNFEESKYKDSRGKWQPCYAMTRDGFTMLVMGFTGKKAMAFKELYIKRFNEMEEFIKTLVEAKNQFPLLTESIKLLHENPKPYHFSNECNLINKIVLGMTAKQFRLAKGIEKGKSIRPYLTDEQIRDLDKLQKVDIGLLVAMPDYEQRKECLERYYNKLTA